MSPRFLRLAIPVLAAGVLLAWAPSDAPAQIGAEYSFSSATNPYSSISGGTLVIAGNATATPSLFNENQTGGPFDIGFGFTFGCNTYTQFSLTSAGYLMLGGSAPVNQNSNNLAAAPLYPVIAPFWEHQHYYNTYTAAGCAAGGPAADVGVSYLLSGSAPNRVLTVEWKTNLAGDAPYWITCNVPAMHTYQVRLYEGSNRIVFHYGVMVVPGNVNANSSASIGIANGSGDFLSVTPGAPAFASSVTANNSFNNRLSGIATGTEYTFVPDRLVLAGRTGAGNEGVANPVNGSELFSNVVQSIGTQTGYTPLDLRKACASFPMPVTMTITGPQASEYTFDASGTQSWNTTLATNASIAPRINFSPLGGGVRNATLTITNQLTSQSVSFTLAAEGVPRIVWIGDPSEGGTATMADGDVFLNGVQVVFGNSRSFMPFTLQNILDPGIPAPPAQITYTLVDPTGSYSIVPTSDALAGGESSTPEIVFSATQGVGTQEATLIVTADGETRSFPLRAFAAAPGGQLLVGGVELDSSQALFVDGTTCVGEGILSVEVTAVNTGTGDFIVHGVDGFLSDTLIRQGVPPYPLRRDASGNPIRTSDYFLTLGPGVAPGDRNPEFGDLIIPEGESRTFYLNLIPTRPERRYAHLYFRTNGFNLNDPDVSGIPTRGLVRAGAYGRGVGSLLVGEEAGKRPKPVVIPGTDVRESTVVTRRITNGGDCDLRVSRSEFRFEAGDIHDFDLIDILPNTPVVGDDYVLAPGATDSITIRFRPENYGSRRVTLRVVTNDSTLGGEGVTERGVYYWDMYGKGDVGIEARNLNLPPAVINGPGSQGFIVLENTSGELVEIEALNLAGGNGEIAQHSARPWPALPIRMEPGDQIRIWVELRPDPNGAPGDRNAELVVVLKGGREARAQIAAYVGTRLLSVLPATLFTNVKIGVGDVSRRFVAITNTGTLPVHLNDPVLTEDNPGDYQVSPLERRIVQPGQTEVIEVSYTPQAVGVSGGTLSFGSNATNGVQVVTLGGEATSGTAIGNPDVPTIQATTGDNFGRRGEARSASGLHLFGIVPNPAAERVVIRYRMPADAEMQLEVYDAGGRLVRSVLRGPATAGEHVENLDLSELPSGYYTVVLTSGDRRMSRSVNLVR